jgi:hypothetical protein
MRVAVSAAVVALLAVPAVPARGQPTVCYELAVVKASRHAAAAHAFVLRVLGEVGHGHLAAAGFLLP